MPTWPISLTPLLLKLDCSPIEALDEPIFLYFTDDSIINHIIERNLAGWIGAASRFQLRFHSLARYIGYSLQNFHCCTISIFKVRLISRSMVLGYDLLRPSLSLLK